MKPEMRDNQLRNNKCNQWRYFSSENLSAHANSSAKRILKSVEDSPVSSKGLLTENILRIICFHHIIFFTSIIAHLHSPNALQFEH